MAQINKPNTYFNTVLYTGNGSTQSITGVGFQPDMVWTKTRSSTYPTVVTDAVRGATKNLYTSLTDAEDSSANYLTSFNADGFSVGSYAGVNLNGATMVGWSWLGANTTASNTDGSITSTVSTNTTSGFSIVSYTGNGTGSATFGHGLGATPKIVIIKRRDGADGWQFWFNNSVRLNLQATNADYGNHPISTSSTLVTTPSTVDTAWNTSSATYISYCFAEKKGFSKFGSYTGNGSADGTFVYTGFKPAFVMVKRSDGVVNWQLIDNKRSDAGGNNIIDKVLAPNVNDAEYDEGSSTWCGDLLSNGFKWRGDWGALNASGGNYIYMAFAENPLVGTNNIPTTAR